MLLVSPLSDLTSFFRAILRKTYFATPRKNRPRQHVQVGSGDSRRRNAGAGWLAVCVLLRLMARPPYVATYDARPGWLLAGWLFLLPAGMGGGRMPHLRINSRKPRPCGWARAVCNTAGSAQGAALRFRGLGRRSRSDVETLSRSRQSHFFATWVTWPTLGSAAARWGRVRTTGAAGSRYGLGQPGI